MRLKKVKRGNESLREWIMVESVGKVEGGRMKAGGGDGGGIEGGVEEGTEQRQKIDGKMKGDTSGWTSVSTLN